MTQWSADMHARIAGAIKRARGKRSAQWLADQTTELGYPITRAQIANYESGRKQSLDVAELLVIAEALKVPPVALIYPDLPDGQVELLPRNFGPSAGAVWWFTGERDDPAGGDLGRLLWLTRLRYAKHEQVINSEKMLERIHDGQVPANAQKLIADLLGEIRAIDQLIREIPGSVVKDDDA